MKVLKWYSIIFMILEFVLGIYNSGKDKEPIGVLLEIILLIPIIIYLILS